MLLDSSYRRKHGARDVFHIAAEVP